jgi:Bacterial Ig-like domain/Polysaccharide lyase family 4, domain II
MKPLFFFFFSILIISKMLVMTSCANIIPPTGGPRDSIPPKLVLVNPENNSLQFKANRVVINFDEFVDLKDIQTNLTVSPVPKSQPLIESKLRTITIRLKDTLQPNTTYSIDFGNAIRDINEGNILKNFSYIFSTGNYIDSTQYSGRVILAATGKVDSTIVAMLYDNMVDSAVINGRPRYTTHIDTSGNFTFRHLKPGTYTLFAMKDESGTRKYLSKSQLFAFAEAPVEVKASSTPLILYAYADTSAANNPGSKTTKKVIKPAQPAAQSKKKDEEKVKRLQFALNLTDLKLDLLSNLEMQFQTPLKHFDSSKIKLTDDKFNEIPVSGYVEDSTHKKLTIKAKWVIDTKYHLIAAKDFAEDTMGYRLLKIDTISFKTKSEADYGSLRIRFTNLDLTRNPVLQFVQNDAIKFSRPLSNRVFTEKLFLPGDYDLRILYDDNKNGVWDPGEFFLKHKQPEKVLAIRKKLTVRANWDNEPDYIL